VIDAPDLAGRIAILKVHAKGKPLATDVSLEKIARSTPGFCGADLANALNEAALLATRRSHEVISQKDLEEAVEKVVAGPERKSHRLGDEERRRVAFHEAGHAVVAASLKDADPVHKISIVPRGRATLGYTWQVPATEQFILSKSALLDRLRSLMGGRAAEEVMFHDMTTGAANDLEKATAIAEQMVCVFGMSEGVGLVHYAHQRPLFLPAIEGDALPRSVSPETATLIDHEVRQILDQAYQDALEILLAKRPKLEAIAEALVARETLDGEELEGMLRPLKADRPS
jgi:cell division protease FtsH